MKKLVQLVNLKLKSNGYGKGDVYMLKYRRQEAKWDITDNPCIAEHWVNTGSIVEILENNKVIDYWHPKVK